VPWWDVDEACGQLVAAERPASRPVGEHERRAVPAEELDDVVGDPALVPELDRALQSVRNLGQAGWFGIQDTAPGPSISSSPKV